MSAPSWRGDARRIDTDDGIQLYAELRAGDGAEGLPLVCCNGVGVTTTFWVDLQRDFASRHPVLVWDYRGHGRSDAPPDLNGLTMERNVADLMGVLDAYGIDRAVLIGHSMGCQVILEAALRHPERVAGLVPMLGTYGRPIHTFFNSPIAALIAFRLGHAVALRAHRPLSYALGALARSDGIRRGIAAGARLLSLVDPARMPNELLLAYIHHLGQLDPRVFMKMAEKMAFHSVEAALPEITAPTLVVAGTRDSFTPLVLSEELTDRLPHAELLILKGGTHTAHVEQPELVRWRLEAFLERVEAPSPEHNQPLSSTPEASLRVRL